MNIPPVSRQSCNVRFSLKQRIVAAYREIAIIIIDEELAQVALIIVRERYADFGPTLACEKLRELHGVDLSKETVRKLMSAVGL